MTSHNIDIEIRWTLPDGADQMITVKSYGSNERDAMAAALRGAQLDALIPADATITSIKPVGVSKAWCVEAAQREMRTKLQQKIEQQDKERGRPLTDTERLANLQKFLDEPEPEPFTYEQTDQGSQAVIPGTEKSAKQASAARRPMMRHTRPQRNPGGLFEPTEREQQNLF